MRFFRKQYEANWRDEIACRWAYWRHERCLRRGGHRWGPVHVDSLMSMYGQECKRCETFQTVQHAPVTFSGTTTNASSITFRFDQDVA